MASKTQNRERARPFSAPEPALPELEPGDHLDQPTFHARYEAMGDDVRAELIEGVVYMPSPAKSRHGTVHAKVMGWLFCYEEATPGTETLDNATDILGPQSEPQPDGCLIVVPASGGQTRVNAEEYLEGPAELIVEVASSSESYDLHSKKRDYERGGVREYVVVALRQAHVFWFVSRNGKFVELTPGSDGILHSEFFAGLWLDPDALLRKDTKRLLEVLRQGLATQEHAAFAARVAPR